jgi:hypothetical protein
MLDGCARSSDCHSEVVPTDGSLMEPDLAIVGAAELITAGHKP